jgi:hypothetical protein
MRQAVLLLVGLIVQDEHHQRDPAEQRHAHHQQPRQHERAVEHAHDGVVSQPQPRPDHRGHPPSPRHLPTPHRAPLVILDPQCEQAQLAMQLGSQPMHLPPQIGEIALKVGDVLLCAGLGPHVTSVIGLAGRATDRRLRCHHTVLLGGHQNASGASRHGAARDDGADRHVAEPTSLVGKHRPGGGRSLPTEPIRAGGSPNSAGMRHRR